MTDHNLFDAANVQLEAGNHETAFDLFMQSVKSGDMWGMNSIGYCFERGIGVKKDFKNAMAWYRRAALKGDSAGCANLAVCYRDSGNVRRAKIWFARAVELQDADAAVELAKIYLRYQSKNAKSAAAKYIHIAINSKNITDDGIEEARKLQAELDLNRRIPQ